MPFIQCKKCDRAFDASYAPNGAPQICPHCGQDNTTGAVAAPIKSADAIPSSAPSSTAGGSTPPQPVLTPSFAGGAGTGGTPPAGAEGRVMSEWERDWKTAPVQAYIATAKRVLTAPTTYFGKIKPAEDFLSLAVLCYANILIVSIFNTIFKHTFGFSVLAVFSRYVNQLDVLMQGGSFIWDLCWSFVSPVFFILFLILGAGIHQLLLKAIANTRMSFDTTLTVWAFATIPLLFTIVPFIGAMVNFVYQVLIMVFGMAKAHEVGEGQAFIAWIIPVLVCCCCFAGVGIFFGAAIIAMLQGMAH